MTALNLDAVAHEAGFAKLEDFFAAVARTEINTRAAAGRDPGGGEARRRTRRSTMPAVVRQQSKAAGSGSGILIVGVDRLMTGTRALLQAGAARSDRRLRHARQGHHDPSAELHQRRAHARAPARAPHHRGLGRARARKCSRWTSSSRRWTGKGCCATCRKSSRARRSTSPRSTRSRATCRRACRSRSRSPISAQLKRALALVREVSGVLSAGRR